MPYVYAACAVCVTIYSTGGKFQPVSICTKLHALTLATRSYALLVQYRVQSYVKLCSVLYKPGILNQDCPPPQRMQSFTEI